MAHPFDAPDDIWELLHPITDQELMLDPTKGEIMATELYVRGLKVGQKYRIVFGDGSLKPRETVLKYLGATGEDTPLASLAFDARPLAGTQTIYVKDVQQMWETEHDLMLPRIYRGEVRVY